MTDRAVVVDLIGHLRTTVESARELATELEAGLGAAERVADERQLFHTKLMALEEAHQALRGAQDELLREREAILAMLDALRGEHQTVKQSLADLQDQHQTLLKERVETSEALKTLVQRLRS